MDTNEFKLQEMPHPFTLFLMLSFGAIILLSIIVILSYIISILIPIAIIVLILKATQKRNKQEEYYGGYSSNNSITSLDENDEPKTYPQEEIDEDEVKEEINPYADNITDIITDIRGRKYYHDPLVEIERNFTTYRTYRKRS